MQEDQDRSRRRKALWLLLALLVLGLAGGVFVAIDDDKPGSDVLGLKVPPTTEPSGAAGGSGVSPGTPAGGTTKGGSSDSGDTVGAAAQPGGSNGSTPLPPTITKAPEDPTFDTTAQFKFTGQSGVGFRCRLDGGAVSSCNSGTANYNKLEPGEHTFEVRAINASAALSAPATYTWTILLRSGFEITGSLDQVLYPGTSERVNLSLGNPYNFPLRVLGVEVTVEPETTNPGCIGDDNLSVVHGLTGEVVVPARSTMSLLELGVDPGLWPLVEMLNLDTNQDACKNATFKLSYEGTGTKA